MKLQCTTSERRTGCEEKLAFPPSKSAVDFGCKLLHWRETGVGFERNEGDNLQHSGFEDRQALAGLPHLGLVRCLPHDSGARRIATPPDLSKDARDVELFDPLAFLGDQFGCKSLRWKRIGTAARKR